MRKTRLVYFQGYARKKGRCYEDTFSQQREKQSESSLQSLLSLIGGFIRWMLRVPS
jgi:hypothetical protein